MCVCNKVLFKVSGSTDHIIFSYSGPLGILGSDGKQNTTKSGARRRENCCTFHLLP